MSFQVSSVLKVVDSKVYMRVKEFGELIGVDLKPEMKNRGVALYKTSSRFLIAGESKPKKCAKLTDVSDRELSLAKGN